MDFLNETDMKNYLENDKLTEEKTIFEFKEEFQSSWLNCTFNGEYFKKNNCIMPCEYTYLKD